MTYARHTGRTIALPTKSMRAPTLQLLSDSGIAVEVTHERSITADVKGLPGICRAIFAPVEMIPKLVFDGIADIGITGTDRVNSPCLREWPIQFSRNTNGGTRCVIFARADDWTNDIADLRPFRPEEMLADEREVANEYPERTREFFHENGIELKNRDDWTRSAEIAVVEKVCQYGVALVETGTSLAVNGLKEIATIFYSSMVLITHWPRDDTKKDDEFFETATFLSQLLNGTLAARDSIYLCMNAPADKVAAICMELPSMNSPTIQPLMDKNFCAIAAVVPAKEVNAIIKRLMALGARDFVKETPSAVM